MIVKAMCDDNIIQDADTRKTFIMYDSVDVVNFYRATVDRPCSGVFMELTRKGGIETIDIRGNVYVMNNEGKTIQTFQPSEIGYPQAMPQPSK